MLFFILLGKINHFFETPTKQMAYLWFLKDLEEIIPSNKLFCPCQAYG